MGKYTLIYVSAPSPRFISLLPDAIDPEQIIQEAERLTDRPFDRSTVRVERGLHLVNKLREGDIDMVAETQIALLPGLADKNGNRFSYLVRRPTVTPTGS